MEQQKKNVYRGTEWEVEVHDELDIHVRQTYNDPKRSELLPDMRGLKHPAPVVKFQLGPIK